MIEMLLVLCALRVGKRFHSGTVTQIYMGWMR
jgi:hypothetical protein